MSNKTSIYKNCRPHKNTDKDITLKNCISRGIEVSHPIFSVSFSQVFLYPVLHTQCLWGSDNLFQLISGQFFIFFSQVANIYSS